MKASEAKSIASKIDRHDAQLKEILQTIEQHANKGLYKCYVNDLYDGTQLRLKDLGYTVWY